MTTSIYRSPDPEEGGSADNNTPHSVRRHDGTLSLKHPDWTTIKEIEDTRRKILKRVSYHDAYDTSQNSRTDCDFNLISLFNHMRVTHSSLYTPNSMSS